MYTLFVSRCQEKIPDIEGNLHQIYRGDIFLHRPGEKCLIIRSSQSVKDKIMTNCIDDEALEEHCLRPIKTGDIIRIAKNPSPIPADGHGGKKYLVAEKIQIGEIDLRKKEIHYIVIRGNILSTGMLGKFPLRNIYTYIES